MNEVDENQALISAARALMLPLARLLVARGMPYAQAEESLKASMVEASREAHPHGLPHRLVSRIATVTGINRREVTRLMRTERASAEPQRSAAVQLFTRWSTAALYRDAQGGPRALARQGDPPSFESLARSITKDVHPRSLLDELTRLGMAKHDLDSDLVTLSLEAFVPSADRVRMLEFLAHNVGDHLSAAVANVLGPAPRHLERAVFADGLSSAAVAATETWVTEAWRGLVAGLVPFIETLIAGETDLPASSRQQRFRAGLYAYTERDDGATPRPAKLEAQSTPGAKTRLRRRADPGGDTSPQSGRTTKPAKTPRTR